MRVISISENRQRAISEAVDELNRGGVIAFPTETVYGIGVRYGDAAALEKMLDIKGRDRAKPCQILISNLLQAQKLGAEISGGASRLISQFWPGGMTLVVPSVDGGTLGLRMPDLPFVAEVIGSLGAPLVATSANRAGEAAATDPATVIATVGEFLACVLDGGETKFGCASTVVDACGCEPELIREGTIPFPEIIKCWGGD